MQISLYTTQADLELVYSLDKMTKFQASSLSHIMRKPVFLVCRPGPTQTMLDRQTQKMARDLKFQIYQGEGLYQLCSKNKGADQLHCYRTADLSLCYAPNFEKVDGAYCFWSEGACVGESHFLYLL